MWSIPGFDGENILTEFRSKSGYQYETPNTNKTSQSIPGLVCSNDFPRTRCFIFITEIPSHMANIQKNSHSKTSDPSKQPANSFHVLSLGALICAENSPPNPRYTSQPNRNNESKSSHFQNQQRVFLSVGSVAATAAAGRFWYKNHHQTTRANWKTQSLCFIRWFSVVDYSRLKKCKYRGSMLLFSGQ